MLKSLDALVHAAFALTYALGARAPLYGKGSTAHAQFAALREAWARFEAQATQGGFDGTPTRTGVWEYRPLPELRETEWIWFCCCPGSPMLKRDYDMACSTCGAQRPAIAEINRAIQMVDAAVQGVSRLKLTERERRRAASSFLAAESLYSRSRADESDG